MLNLFAFRATDPTAMKSQIDPIGIDNNRHILSIAESTSEMICAWGTHGVHMGRDNDIIRLLEKFDLKCLAMTKNGNPGHPLYLKKDLVPFQLSPNILVNESQ